MSRWGILARLAITGLPEISLPTAKARGLRSFFHSLLSRIERRVTSAGRTFGISIPTRRVPGIGASIRTLSTARLRASSLSRAAILERTTPVGGWMVYCVTRGPTLAPSSLTSIPKSEKVELIMKAFCWILPPSGGFCFLDRRSVLGIFQFGSETSIRARSGSASTGLSITGFLTSIFGVVFRSSGETSTPLALILSGPRAPDLIASSAWARRATRAFSASSSRRLVLKRLARSRKTAAGESCIIKMAVIKMRTR